jgi:hypothetical protein
VLATLDRIGWPDEPEAGAAAGEGVSVRLDVGAKLRALW